MSGPLKLDQPHSARMYDYFLGGKDNYEADRVAANEAQRTFPTLRKAALANRAFMHRAAALLANEGVTQFLDIGTGIPTEPNLHQVVQEITPHARVVYVDNDPLVLTHARALLRGTPEGRSAYIHADLIEPNKILSAPELLQTLDLSKPVALSLVAVLHFIPDEKDPVGIARTLLAGLAPGSFLVATHGTADQNPEVDAAAKAYRASGVFITTRTREQFAEVFTGLELLEPGIVSTVRWRPAIEPTATMEREAGVYAAVGRKPMQG